jgi:hypothetical protein
LSKSNNLSSVQDAIHFYYMPLLYIMGKNIIKNTNNFHKIQIVHTFVSELLVN